MERLRIFKSTLEKLGEIFQYDEPYEIVVLSGCVYLYAYCFDHAILAMREVLTQQGCPERSMDSQKQTLKAAYQVGMILDENVWLDALNVRKNVANVYIPDVALDIVRRTKADFYPMFVKLRDEIDAHWLDI